jgi:hypothetical protein
MALRVYCPDCNAPRRVPAAGSRVRCRNCDRVFRAGTRVNRRDRRDDPVPDDGAASAQKFFLVLTGIALLTVGLVIGGGLVAWYFAHHLPAQPQADPDPMEIDDTPPHDPNPGMIDRGPVENP